MKQMDSEKEREVITIPVEGEDEAFSKSRSHESQSVENTIEQLQRLQADFVNYKRRTEKEMSALSAFVKGNFITSLLPVIDDLDLMVQHHEDGQCPSDAVLLIIQKFKKILTDEGLEVIDAAGKIFDPEIHEAVAVEEVADAGKEDVILEDWQRGYRFQGTLLRPSRVKVAKLKVSD